MLNHAAAALTAVFAERGEIDFSGVAQGAVMALGEEDAPTDLLLAMDARVRHLLVDEFQDTSLGQWELIRRLTAGWSEGDGRTVFLVGDPMQSIYRFREADVALFLRAREHGLPCVRLESLRLRTNFRSQAGVVDWVNATFREVLPGNEDPDSGAVPYAASTARHPALAGDAVHWHPFVGNDIEAAHRAEARRVARVAAQALAEDPGLSVAILVRNRSHLDRIVPALKAAKVRFRAVDIEPLGRRPVVQDLLAITRALSHAADRVAWLALLRAPWCALDVRDLHALPVSSPDGAGLTVWELLNDDVRLACASPEGAKRARRVRDVLRPFVDGRGRGSLRERVEAAWLALGGPACVERASDLEDAETFFDRLEELDEAGELADPTVLEEHLEQLFAAPDVGEDARVQVMTIHKAKGLEFDVVVLPGMHRIPRINERPLFAWRARADGRLMMAPVRAAGEVAEPAYDYVRGLDAGASDHETGRLFYVAATRARRRLHLLGFVRADEKTGELRRPTPRSLLEKAWPAAQAAFAGAAPMAATQAEATPAETDERDLLRQVRIGALDVRVPAAPAPQPAAPSPEPPLRFDWATETARHVGSIAHAWLQRIGVEGLERWDAARIAGLGSAVERALARRGVPASEIAAASQRVRRALEGALGEEKGRWILGSHPESRFEYRLRMASPEGVRLVVIDRLFTDAAGERWIVDYKTSEHEGADLDAFLASEVERYTPQLRRYAAALPGRSALGLYFPLMGRWRTLD
jgi:ATP-dependent exoDNAse (exonuclease V) beta subunit